MHEARAGADRVRIDLELDALSARGRLIPRAGESVLVRVDACGRRPEREIADEIRSGQADQCRGAGRGVDRVHALLVAPPAEDHAIGRTHGERVIEILGRYASDDGSVAGIERHQHGEIDQSQRVQNGRGHVQRAVGRERDAREEHAGIADECRGAGGGVDLIEPTGPVQLVAAHAARSVQDPRERMHGEIGDAEGGRSIGNRHARDQRAGGGIDANQVAGRHRTGRRWIPAADLRRAEQRAVQAEGQPRNARHAGRMAHDRRASIGLADDHERAIVGRLRRPARNAMASEAAVEHGGGERRGRRRQDQQRSSACRGPNHSCEPRCVGFHRPPPFAPKPDTDAGTPSRCDGPARLAFSTWRATRVVARHSSRRWRAGWPFSPARFAARSIRERGDSDQYSNGGASCNGVPQPSWQVCDHSASGSRLRGRISNPRRVVPGSLIAFRGESRTPWTLAVVRRLRRLPGSNVEVGVEHLGRNPQPIVLTMAHPGASGARRFPALYLRESAMEINSRVRSLVVPASQFEPGRVFAMSSAKVEATIRLKGPLEYQSDFVWTTFEVLGSATSETACAAAAAQ